MNYFRNQSSYDKSQSPPPPEYEKGNWQRVPIFDSSKLHMEVASIEIPENWQASSSVTWHYDYSPSIYHLMAQDPEQKEGISFGSASMATVDFVNVWAQQGINLSNNNAQWFDPLAAALNPFMISTDIFLPEAILNNLIIPLLSRNREGLRILHTNLQQIESRTYQGYAYILTVVAEYMKNGEPYSELSRNLIDIFNPPTFIHMKSFSASSPSGKMSGENLEKRVTRLVVTYRENPDFIKIISGFAQKEAQHSADMTQTLQQNRCMQEQNNSFYAQTVRAGENMCQNMADYSRRSGQFTNGWINALTGKDDIYNPVDGKVYKVDSGNYHYVNQQNNTLYTTDSPFESPSWSQAVHIDPYAI